MALMRYAGQGGELAVTWPAQDQMGGGGSPRYCARHGLPLPKPIAG